MTSPVDVCNQALSQMGARAQVASINPSDGTPQGDACSLLYQQQVNAVSRAAHWNCLRFQRALTLIKAQAGTPENINGATLPLPPIPWIYEYELPSDCLAGRFVIPTPAAPGAVSPPLTTGAVPVMAYNCISTSMPFQPAVDYNTQTPPAQIAVILTNAAKAQLVYTARVDNPDLWDASFTNAVIAVLSAWLVNPLNQKASLLTERVAMAKGLIDAARIADGNEGVTPNDSLPDWIAARFRRGDSGYSSGPCIQNWSPIALPGGISY